MTSCTANEHSGPLPSARWEQHVFPHGPLRRVLMHVATDLRSGAAGQGRCAVRVCARLMLADGTLFGLLLSGPPSSLWQALHAAAATLAGAHHAAFDSNSLSAALAVHAGGMWIALEHDARILPSPVVTVGQVARLQRRVRLQASRTATARCACMAAPLAGECTWHHPAVGAWLSALDPHALAYGYGGTAPAHGVARDRLDVYNFLVARQGAYCRERVQAIGVLPWLLPMLTASGRTSREVACICHAIDAREPLFQAVASAFDVPRETVRWLGCAALPGNWSLDPERLRGLLALLSWLPAKLRPSTPVQFETLISLGNVVAAPLEFDDARGCRSAALLGRRASCLRRWLAEAARPGWVAKRPGGEAAMARDAVDAADFLRALLGGAIAQMPGCSAETCVLWVLDWSAGVGLHRLLALSEQWHAAAILSAGVAYDGADDPASGIQDWPTVLPQPWRFEDRTVVELTSSSGLLAEGRALQHCVAGYSYRCVRMDSIIVSVRDADGWAYSTAELHLTGQGVAAGQHRAMSNAAPGGGCERTVAALVGFLNEVGCSALLQRRLAFQRAHAERHESEKIAARQRIGTETRHAEELAWQLALA